MNLNELKEKIDALVSDGCGETETRVTESNNKLALWGILDIGFETISALDSQNKLCEKEVLVLYSGSDEDD